MNLRQKIGSSLSVSGELFGFFWKSQWWWLVPLLVLLLPLGTLFIVAQSSAIAPFIYTLF
jgi:hypothetical protein